MLLLGPFSFCFKFAYGCFYALSLPLFVVSLLLAALPSA